MTNGNGGYDQQAASDWGQSVSDANEEGLFEMSTEDVDETDVGNIVKVSKVGFYHFEIEKAKEEFETLKKDGNLHTPQISLLCRVLASKPELSPVGSVCWHRIFVAGSGGGPIAKGSITAATNFLFGVGVLREVVVKNRDGEETERKYVDPDTATENAPLGTYKINVPTLAERLQGLQFVGEVKFSESDDQRYDDKYEFPFGRGCFRVDDPAVADVPMNADALAVRKPYPAGERESGGGDGGNGAAPQSTNPQPPQQPTQPQQPAQAAQQQSAAEAAPAASGGAWGDDDL